MARGMGWQARRKIRDFANRQPKAKRKKRKRAKVPGQKWQKGWSDGA